MVKKCLLAGIVLAVPAFSLAPQGTAPLYVPVAQAADAEVKPEELAKNAWAVLDKHCTSCHAEGKGKHRASPIDKKTYQKLIDKEHLKPGKPDESPLYTLMVTKDEDSIMPPMKAKVRPTAEEIATIKTWIEKGAPAWSTEEAPK
jgi:mono/diheme cytochrome c family protein